MQAQVQSHAVTSEWRCIVVDWQCRESKGKVKIEGYMSISEEEAHQCITIVMSRLCENDRQKESMGEHVRQKEYLQNNGHSSER